MNIGAGIFLSKKSLLLSAVGLLAALSFAHERTKSPTTSESKAQQAASIIPLSVRSSTARIEVEALTLRTTGFEPAQVTRPQGRFMLAVDNRTEIPDLEFRLNQPNQNPVSAKKMLGRELRWRQLLDLPPGQYILTELNHPRWRAQIKITPQ
jgi:hypothetical protein